MEVRTSKWLRPWSLRATPGSTAMSPASHSGSQLEGVSPASKSVIARWPSVCSIGYTRRLAAQGGGEPPQGGRARYNQIDTAGIGPVGSLGSPLCEPLGPAPSPGQSHCPIAKGCRGKFWSSAHTPGPQTPSK
eukprot:531143-Prorocentrum_minimum.AAC.2